MTCTITNIARFASAELTLGGLTVLSGTNGSGMTTIAKALYAAVKSEIALSHDGRFAGDCSHIITPPCVEDSPANRRLAERAFSAEFGGQPCQLHPSRKDESRVVWSLPLHLQ
jgi:energy-coupling factor transporter ATP-binding protein EcfA2